MTGHEFCDLLEIDYGRIVQNRQADCGDNVEYLLSALLDIEPVRQRIRELPDWRRARSNAFAGAAADPRLKTWFLSYRLNCPTRDESEVLLTVSDWNRECNRPKGLPTGKTIVGVDLGGLIGVRGGPGMRKG